MRRVALAARLCLCLCLGPVTGCFVFDELDAGQQIMDQYSPSRNRAKRRQANARAGEEPVEEAKPGFLDRALTALRAAPSALRELERRWSAGGREPEPRPLDPEDVTVRCEVDGRWIFTRRFECAGRGGRVVGGAAGETSPG